MPKLPATVNDHGSQLNFDELQKRIDLLNARMLRGAGSPEGVVFSAPGVLYERQDGGAGTSIYVKETAVTLNTGWRAL